MLYYWRKDVMDMITLWAIAAGVFLLVEAVTAAMTSIWFTVGALAALIAAVCHAALWLQIGLFLVVSGLCFVLLYPRLRRFIKRSGQPTNIDRLIGQTCPVTADIDPLTGSGSVYIDGKTWSAKSTEAIAAGQIVRVEEIQGVKLIVSPVEKQVIS